MQPGFAGPAVGVHKDQDFEIGWELFDTNAEIVDLFAGARWLAGDDNMSFHSRGSGDALHEAVRRIIFGCEDEKNFEILVIEFAERDKIALETGFHTAARAENGGTGGKKTGIGVQAAAHVGEPLDTLPEQEEPCGDLEYCQKFEKSFHASRA
jgi:hypothetical protein